MSGSRQACLVGVGESAYTKRGGSSVREYRLACEAILLALADAGLSPSEVDGFAPYADERSQPTTLAGDLGVQDLRFATTTAMLGGGGACAAVLEAALAIEAGQADVVVAYRSLCQGQFARIGGVRADQGPTGPPGLQETGLETEALHSFSAPFGILGPAVIFALPMRRHMEVFGTTSEQLGMVAVTQRAHAARNPRAVMGDRPLTLADHQSSRMVADPYRLFDCCLETDGACAVVVTTAERAADLRHRPVSVLAAAEGSDGARLGGAMANAGSSAAGYPGGGSEPVGKRLFGAAGVRPGDVDVAQLYDNFTGQVLFGLEDFGFCGRGESGPFVESGALAWPGGSLPTNTAGGNLSEAYMQGLNHMIEGVRQLRGDATSQVPDAELCLVTSSPGIPTSALLLARA